MADVFVSYKAEDRRRVKPLVDALEADGFSVWWDAQIGNGAAWRQTIETELTAAKCAVVVWSKRSVGPDAVFVHDEATRAQHRGVYVPVTIDKVQVPLGFGETQATSLSTWNGNRTDQRYQSVLEAVQALVSKSPIHRRSGEVAEPGVSRRLILGAAGAGSVAAIAGGWLVFRPKTTAASNRIAVLPFANLSGDPAQAYFSDGIAEELRSSLSRVGLQVIGRTSSAEVKDLNTKAAAAKLGVANILTGSVRRSPSTIRIDAQLIDGSDGVERWAQSYDRQPGDAIKIQTDIAENVAQVLSIVLGRANRAALNLGGTSDPAAQDLVLKVKRNTSDSEAGIQRDLALLDAVLELDPNYAEAYALKAVYLSAQAGTYAKTAEANRRGQAEALAIANRALSIAPQMAVGYAARSTVYQQRLQIGPALVDARRAAALPGENADVLSTYAWLLALAGNFQEALRLSAREISLDPLSPEPYDVRAIILFYARRYDEAVDNAKHGLAIAPNQEQLRSFLGHALLFLGKSAEAEAEYREIDPASWRRAFGETVIAARTGERSLALQKLKLLNSDAGHYQFAQIYAQLGMAEDAFKELGLAWQARDTGFPAIRVDPFLDPLRSDPRIAALERKIGFS